MVRPSRFTPSHPKRSVGSTVCPHLIAVTMLGITLGASGCARKRLDPVDTLKAMVPRIEAALNRRDIASLQRLGTPRFSANRLIIDVSSVGADTVDLRIKHLAQTPGEAQLVLTVALPADETAPRFQLTLRMVGDREWRIDSFTFGPAPPADRGDSVGSGG